MSFSEELFRSDKIQSILGATKNHPFNLGIADGTLSIDKFQFYLKQDSLYLIDFARALAIAGARSKESENMEKFISFANGALVAERSLHQHYFNFYGITLDVSQSPSCFSYTNFLLAATLQRDWIIGVAALLPCFWIYREVGRDIANHATQDNPFHKWIETYAAEEFDKVVLQASGILDSSAEKASLSTLEEVREAFIMSCRLEWLFWESAYTMEQWKPDMKKLKNGTS